jgi:hypothetical protein
MESVSGLKFDGHDVTAIVFEGASESGYREHPMRLRELPSRHQEGDADS